MKRINVLIVEDNKNIVKMIKEYFKGNKYINIKYKAYNGEEGIKIINDKEIDLILLDLILPNKDGISLLEYMKKKKINKKVIVLTSFETKEVIQKVLEMGVNYYIKKPFELSDLEKRIIEISHSHNLIKEIPYNYDKDLTNMLHNLGVPSHIKGYRYIKDAVLMMVYENNKSRQITKSIYPEISKKYSVSNISVEKAIRHAIELGWVRANYSLVEEMFGYSIDLEKAKPTNLEYIITITEKLKLENKN